MIQQLLIGMQLLTGTSHHFFRYDTTTTKWDSIKNSINAWNIIFARLATANLHYGLFEELVKDFSSLPIADIPKDPIVGIHYGQYSELVADPLTFDVDKNDDKGVVDNKVANNGAADDKLANNGATNGNDNQGKDNDQNSDGDYKEE